MFESLRLAFRQAVQNFHEELNRAPDPMTEEGAFLPMTREIESASQRVEELRRGLKEARMEVDREEASLEVCRRRLEQARSIGDEETVRISGDFVEKHRRRSEILRDKAGVLAREIEEWEGELLQMHERYRAARRSWESSRGGLAGT